MKKYIITFLGILAFFLGTSSLKAETILYRTSDSSGNVNVSLHADDGYVGALDITVSITGNVEMQSLSWDSSLSSKYTKEYTYDKSKKQVRIYIATGSTKNNLADPSGKIKLANLHFKSMTGKDEKFNVTIEKVTFVNARYKSIEKMSLSNDSNQDFEYKVEEIGNGGSTNSDSNHDGNSAGSPSNDGSSDDGKTENKKKDTPSDDMNVSVSEQDSSMKNVEEKNKDNGKEIQTSKVEKENHIPVYVGMVFAIAATIVGIVLYRKYSLNSNKKN